MLSPDDDDLLTTRFPERYQMLHIQPGQATSHITTKNQILYLMNTKLHLQFVCPCLQEY